MNVILTENTKKHWFEDFSHENGNYQCKCVKCESMFAGHKRRVICKECSSEGFDMFKFCQSMNLGQAALFNQLTNEDLTRLKFPIEKNVNSKLIFFCRCFHIHAKFKEDFKNGVNEYSKDQRIKISMVSRMGDIGITTDDNSVGYEVRGLSVDLFHSFSVTKIKDFNF